MEINNEMRILRHFMCEKCNKVLDIVTGDSQALLTECPECSKKFNIVIVKVPLKDVKFEKI